MLIFVYIVSVISVGLRVGLKPTPTGRKDKAWLRFCLPNMQEVIL